MFVREQHHKNSLLRILLQLSVSKLVVQYIPEIILATIFYLEIALHHVTVMHMVVKLQPAGV